MQGGLLAVRRHRGIRRSHKSLGLIGSSEDMIEIDFADGKVSRVGDQYGVGRVVRTSTN